MTTNRGAESPLALLTRLAECVAVGDVAGVLGLYAADSVVTLRDGREAAGLGAIEAAYAGALASGAGLGLSDEAVAGARVIETGSLAMTSFTGVDGVVRTLVAWRGDDGRWAFVRDGSMLRDVEAALGGAGLSEVA
jgi:hypothetical protein